jgi:serine/threonine-protein kinase
VSAAAQAENKPLIIGRYALFDVLASGGMATVHLGRLLGSEGFGRTVAVKRLHAHFASDQEFVTMFTDEARIVARIRHPNVVPMVDVMETPQGLFLVMEYVHGETFSRLLRAARNAQQLVPLNVVTAIMHGVLLGLHSAHETRGTQNELLDIVHRDVSPQNVIVGSDGIARVLDFGVAKAAGRAQVTREGQIKGKLAYMSPEQIRGRVDRRADVFACGVCLWEALVGKRLHEGARDVEIVTRIMQGTFPKPSLERPDVPADLDEIVMRALAADPAKRYPNAREMALDLERSAIGLAPSSVVGPWVEKLAPEALRARMLHINAMERAAAKLAPVTSDPPPALGPPMPPPAPPPPMAPPPITPPAMVPQPQMVQPPALPMPYESVPQSDLSANGGTPIGQSLPSAPPMPERQSHAVVIALISFLIALALIGVVLIVLTFQRRALMQQQPTLATSSTPSVLPAVLPTPSVTPDTSVRVPAPVVVDAGVAASASASTRAPVKPWTPPPQTSAPKKCEPYTIDAQGHRKYNLECLDRE